MRNGLSTRIIKTYSKFFVPNAAQLLLSALQRTVSHHASETYGKFPFLRNNFVSHCKSLVPEAESQPGDGAAAQASSSKTGHTANGGARTDSA
jgi:hypothetical protein